MRGYRKVDKMTFPVLIKHQGVMTGVETGENILDLPSIQNVLKRSDSSH